MLGARKKSQKMNFTWEENTQIQASVTLARAILAHQDKVLRVKVIEKNFLAKRWEIWKVCMKILEVMICNITNLKRCAVELALKSWTIFVLLCLEIKKSNSQIFKEIKITFIECIQETEDFWCLWDCKTLSETFKAQ